MVNRILFFALLFISTQVFSQSGSDDMGWWNKLHGWEEGDPGWRNWMIISPGYLGPNALPVPEVKRGFLNSNTEIELTASTHLLKGDPTQDISGRLFVPFCQNKIAIEIYGVVVEHFAFSEEIRNERFARIEDGKGYAFGDLYFSTLVQLWKNRKMPDALLRMAGKTASGNQLEGARNTDSPGYFFDISFSKELAKTEKGYFRPFGLAGFYSWQTNDELNLQNDAFLYALGADYSRNNWNWSASWSGYSGYKNQRDKPMQLNFEMRKDFEGKAFRIQYLHGLRDWEYKTIKFSFIWKLKPVN
ncbi:MAG TPA: hypothetical protein DER09_12460 [Prolixibacteraceae bacterium]|nr:hypothetical protein [Prolixibacteraceae bacterium]